MPATIVSLFPEEINEFKPRLIPSYFKIPAAPQDGFVCVVINKAQFPIEVADGERTFLVPELPEDVAKAIVEDWVSAKIGVTPEDRPGVFWVDGAFDNTGIEKNFPLKLTDARNSQIRWFKRLVELANDEFARTKQVRTISDLQKTAAKYLGLTDLPWMQVEIVTTPSFCKFCTIPVPEHALVCPNCHNVLDVEGFKKAGGLSAARV